MKPVRGKWFLRCAGLLMMFSAILAAAALPALAQENSPDASTTPIGIVFRWLNFILVIGALAYLIVKFGAPYFRGHAESIAKSIAEAAERRAAAERELTEATEKLARVAREIEEEQRAAVRESAANQERIRALAKTEAERIGQAARAEINAAERAGTQQLRAIAARLATEQAAVLIRTRMSAATESALFNSFVGELERAAP
jgi:F-type H+-transporting ATPase subunit b